MILNNGGDPAVRYMVTATFSGRGPPFFLNDDGGVSQLDRHTPSVSTKVLQPGPLCAADHGAIYFARNRDQLGGGERARAMI